MARSDIEATLRICDLADRFDVEQDDDLYFALHYAVVVSYTRPFSGNDLGSLKGKWGKFGDPRLDDAHKHLVNVRNKYVAHSDASARPVTIHTPGARLADETIAPSYGVQALNEVCVRDRGRDSVRLTELTAPLTALRQYMAVE